MDSQLTKRIKSLLWRAAMMAIAVFVAGVSDGLVGLELPLIITGVLGLILGEVSKHISNLTKK